MTYGIVKKIGWEKDEEGNDVFRAIIDFPNGPPDLTWRTVWKQEPVIVTTAPEEVAFYDDMKVAP